MKTLSCFFVYRYLFCLDSLPLSIMGCPLLAIHSTILLPSTKPFEIFVPVPKESLPLRKEGGDAPG